MRVFTIILCIYCEMVVLIIYLVCTTIWHFNREDSSQSVDITIDMDKPIYYVINKIYCNVTTCNKNVTTYNTVVLYSICFSGKNGKINVASTAQVERHSELPPNITIYPILCHRLFWNCISWNNSKHPLNWTLKTIFGTELDILWYLIILG